MKDAFDGEIYNRFDVEHECHCVDRHNPVVMHLVRHHVIPLSAGGEDTDDNVTWLCLTAHADVHQLVREYERFGGMPPWQGVRWYYVKYLRELARIAWEARN